jgi:hypothetical protein
MNLRHQVVLAGASDVAKQIGPNATNAEVRVELALGAGAGPKVLAAPPNTPLSAILSPDALAHNPQWANMTTGQFLTDAETKYGNDKFDASSGAQPVVVAPVRAYKPGDDFSQWEADAYTQAKSNAQTLSQGDPVKAAKIYEWSKQ